MGEEPLLLRFDSRDEALSVLAGAGIPLVETIGNGGIPHGTAIAVGYAFDAAATRPSRRGEMVEFEGEPVELKALAQAFHVLLTWKGEPPAVISRYIT
ncbi:MAG: hypothetical protein PW791_17115 [Neorhizobium sp.]|nr:hypothetical protein [Neorhizobium sp.]